MRSFFDIALILLSASMISSVSFAEVNVEEFFAGGDFVDFYKALEVPPTAKREDIRSAYFRKIDAKGDTMGPPMAKLLSRAFNTLEDTTSRDVYDRAVASFRRKPEVFELFRQTSVGSDISGAAGEFRLDYKWNVGERSLVQREGNLLSIQEASNGAPSGLKRQIDLKALGIEKTSAISDIDISPNGEKMVIALSDRRLMLVDLTSNTVLHQAEQLADIQSSRFVGQNLSVVFSDSQGRLEKPVSIETSSFKPRVRRVESFPKRPTVEAEKEAAAKSAKEQNAKKATQEALRLEAERLSKVRDDYEFFGLKRNASPEEIKKAWQSFSQKFHPDKNGNADWATELFKRAKDVKERVEMPRKEAAQGFHPGASFGDPFKELDRIFESQQSTDELVSATDDFIRVYKDLFDTKEEVIEHVYWMLQHFQGTRYVASGSESTTLKNLVALSRTLPKSKKKTAFLAKAILMTQSSQHRFAEAKEIYEAAAEGLREAGYGRYVNNSDGGSRCAQGFAILVGEPFRFAKEVFMNHPAKTVAGVGIVVLNVIDHYKTPTPTPAPSPTPRPKERANSPVAKP